MNLPKGKNVGGWEETVVWPVITMEIGLFDGGREPRVGDRIVFRDMIHYTMVKNDHVQRGHHPSIGIWNPGDRFSSGS